MTDSIDSKDLPEARRVLALVQAETGRARADLADVYDDLIDAKRELNGLRSQQLLDANEHLVLAALKAQDEAETASHDFEQLARTSHLDELTGVATRAVMRGRLDGAIAMARRHGSHMAVLFVDLDHFKQVNDSFGHLCGDEVLRYTARQLESVVRDSDTVCRYGGDEFVVLLAELSQPGDAQLLAAKMLIALAKPCLVGEHSIALSASVGVALYPVDGSEALALIAHADAAMYAIKYKRRVTHPPMP